MQNIPLICQNKGFQAVLQTPPSKNKKRAALSNSPLPRSSTAYGSQFEHLSELVDFILGLEFINCNS